MNEYLLNVNEVATMLNIKENTLRLWLSKGIVIPKSLVIKLGRRTLFHKGNFIEWVNSCLSK